MLFLRKIYLIFLTDESSVIVENTKTKIYLANDNMNVESQKSMKVRFKWKQEIGMIEALVPKKEYYTNLL